VRTAEASLAGFTVAVTADRHSCELANLLELRGARVVAAPVLRIVPFPDDAELRASTTACVERPLDVVVATTGIGLRRWLEASDGWGLPKPLRVRLAGAHLVACGPKARRAARASGLVEDWAPVSESSDEVLDYLLGRGVTGSRIAVQLHGEPQSEFCDALRTAGAEVLEVPVYRCGPPADPAPLRRLVDLIRARLVDAVTFTSAPAAFSLLGLCDQPTLDRLRDTVIAACVGPVTAAPLQARGVPTITPDDARLGALVQLVVDELLARSPTLQVAGAQVTLRGHAVVVDDRLRPLSPGQMAVLRALAEAGGDVMSRAALLAALPSGANTHTVDMAVARLRVSLGSRAFIQTATRHGYRLAVD
jgi:uroporphyrinogen-III synthase